MSVGLGNINAGADGGRHRLLNQIHAACSGLNTGIHHGALFHLGNAGGDADDDTGLKQLEAAGHLVDKLLEHALGHIVVGDDAFTQRTNGHDVAGGTAQHRLCLGAHLQQLAAVLINRHHGRLVQYHTLAFYINQYRCGTQINTNIFCQ